MFGATAPCLQNKNLQGDWIYITEIQEIKKI